MIENYNGLVNPERIEESALVYTKPSTLKVIYPKYDYENME